MKATAAEPVLAGAIDVHAHYLPPSYRASALEHGQDHPDGMPALPEWNPTQALTLMDEVGIAASVLSISSPGISFVPDPQRRAELARSINDEGAATVAAHPSRFGFFATLPLPDVPAAVAEIARAFDVCGADGVGLHTHTSGVYLGDERLIPVLETLNARSAVVAIHPTSPCNWEVVAFDRPRPLVEFLLDTSRAVINLTLSGSLGRFPNIRWIVPHAGAALPVLADRVALLQPPGEDAGLVDVLGALSGLFYDLAGVPVPRALRALLNLVDNDRLLYGSDYPFTPPSRVSSLARQLVGDDALDPSARRAVFSSNAWELFPRLAPGGADPTRPAAAATEEA